MTQNFRQLSILTCIVMFSIIMVASQGMLDKTYAESSISTKSDSVGDIHVRASFVMDDGYFVVDNFKVFNQMEGFRSEANSRVTATFQLWGAPDYSHIGLYKAADAIHSGMTTAINPNIRFDTYIEIYQNDLVFRTFEYDDCAINNYVFTTLHDGDETFSGKTQFVYADVFEIECDGYVADSPFYYTDMEVADTKSSTDYQSEQRFGWSEEFK